MAVTDDLNAAITQLTFNATNNAPISQLTIGQLQACAAQLSPGTPLSELQDAISQLQWAAPNNAPASLAVISELNDVLSQLLYGTQTTSPADLQAIGQISNYILAQEPDWGPLLWINWDGSTNLTVQVRGVYAPLVIAISTVPWWTYWDNYYDAADNIVATIYLMQAATQATMLMEANNGRSTASSACSSC